MSDKNNCYSCKFAPEDRIDFNCIKIIGFVFECTWEKECNHWQPKPQSEWIEWHGGECPVDPVNTEIQVVYGSGEVGNTNMPGILAWRHAGLSESYKIKRYRLINEGEMPNKTELKKELDELSAKMDAIIERMAEINEELKKKTYPVGYDPEGEYLTTLDKEGKVIVSKFKDIIPVNRALISKTGNSFTTHEQAQNRADGLNALHELIQVIHEENEKCEGDKKSEFRFNAVKEIVIIYSGIVFSCGEKLRMKDFVAGNVINRLGEQKIITALKYGLA